MLKILAILLVAAMGNVAAFEIHQDFEGDGIISSRIDTVTGGSTLQSIGPVAGGRIVTGGVSQFTGLDSNSGRFRVWGSIGPEYSISLTGQIYATATIKSKYGNDTLEGGEVDIDATVRNGTIDEELAGYSGGCHPHIVKYLGTEGNVSDMMLKTKVIW